MNRQVEVDNDDEEPNRWASLAAMVFVAGLIALSVWVANLLHKHTQREDCLLSGRSNCEQIVR